MRKSSTFASLYVCPDTKKLTFKCLGSLIRQDETIKNSKSITNRSSEALDKYLVEIGRAPLISIDEESSLPKRLKRVAPKVNVLRTNW